MLLGKTEMLYPVESYIYEDGQGLSGWIENKRILLGTRELMENHSIEGLPSAAKEQEIAGSNVAVYLSISGVVTTLFVVRAVANPSIAGWMQELENEGIVTVIRTVDSFLTKDFICSAFGVDKSSVRFLPFRYHKDYDEQTDYVPSTSATVICSGHFQSLAMLILGAKRLKAAADIGVAFQFGGAVMGAFLCFIMGVTGSFSQISASAVLGYNLLLVAVALLVNKVKKV
jgi:Cu+-exporting ATPase